MKSNNELAEKFYLKSKNLCKLIFNKNHQNTAFSYLNLGIFYLNNYNFINAIKYLKKS